MPQIAEVWKPPYINSFAGGMNQQFSPFQLEDNEVRYILNMILDQKGACRKRGGYSKEFATAITGAVQLDNMCVFSRAGGTSVVISVHTASYDKIFDYDGTTMTEVTGGTVLSAGGHVEFCVYNDYLFIANGVQFQYWNGAGAKADCVFFAGSETPKPKKMAISDDRMFATVAASAYRFEVYVSQLYVWTTSPGTDLVFDTGDMLAMKNKPSDSNGINNLYQYGNTDNLIMATDNACQTVLGNNSSDYEMQLQSRIAGCVSPNGICETNQGWLVMVGNENVYLFDGQKITPIGDQIRPLLKGKNMAECFAFYYQPYDSVIIGCQSGCFVWNQATSGWSVFDIPIKCAAVYGSSGSYNKCVFARWDTPYLYLLDSGTADDGADIEWLIETKEFDLGEFMMERDLRAINIACETAITTPCKVTAVRYSKTDGMNSTPNVTATCMQGGPNWDEVNWDEFAWGDSCASIAIADFPPGLAGGIHKVSLGASDQNPITIYKLGLSMKQLARL